MLTSEAHVETDRPSRYLIQLGRHAQGMSRHLHRRPRSHSGDDTHERPPEVQHAEWSDTHGTIVLPWGQCTMQATPAGLTLRAEAPDEASLRRIQDGIAARLEKIGRRDQLKVNWRPAGESAAEPEQATGTARVHTGRAAAHRGIRSRIGLIAIGVLAVLVHLGLLGATLASARWTGAAADIVLALVLVKIVIVPAIGLRRFTTRRRKASKAPEPSGSGPYRAQD